MTSAARPYGEGQLGRWGARAGLACALALCFWSASASAQVGERRDPTTMGDERLAEEGWTFSPERTNPGSPGAGVVALTGGALWHGVGHLMIDDKRSSLRLLAMEGVAVGAFTAGTLARRLGEAPAVRESGATLQTAAVSLFVASWMADVLGATKGGGDDLPQNSRRLDGLSAEVYVASLLGGANTVTNGVVVRLPWEARRGSLTPSFEVGADLSYTFIGVVGGVRIPVGRHADSWIELGGGGLEDRDREAGTGRTQLRVRALASLDLGEWFPHLRGLVWENDLSLTMDHVLLESDNLRRFRRDTRSWHAPYGFALHVNVDRGVNLGVGYRRDHDALVGNAGRRVGQFVGRLSVVPRNRLGIELEGQQGASTRVLLGLRYVFFGRRE